MRSWREAEECQIHAGPIGRQDERRVGVEEEQVRDEPAEVVENREELVRY